MPSYCRKPVLIIVAAPNRANTAVTTGKIYPITLHTPLFWSPFLLNEIVAFLLTVAKAIKYRSRSENTRLENNMNLTKIIIHDNMMYFSA